MKLNGCSLNGNSASHDGGGAYAGFRGVHFFDNCTIKSNTAEGNGGGVCSNGGNTRLTNCILTANMGASNGGAAYNYHSSYNWLRVVNCALVTNVAGGSGGGVFNENDAIMDVVNTILWENSDSGMDIEASQFSGCGTGSCSLDYCCIQGLDLYSGNGNIGTDPLFVDPLGIDGIAGTEDDDLRLQIGSPCVDAGDNSAIPDGTTIDLDGLPRIHACIVDMGAYENQDSYFFGDADENCFVDIDDYLDFNFCLERFGYERNPILDACIQVFDSDGDLDVDLADFAAFQVAFSQFGSK